MKNFLTFASSKRILIIVLFIFLLHLVLRGYQTNIRNTFGYDQVDYAWAAKNILVEHRLPLVGTVAKGNSGIYLGPGYYYLVAFYYALFDLNPVASQALAISSSIFTFWVIFIVFKKLISQEAAIMAVFINTFSTRAIMFDRVEWPVQLLPAVSLLVFYFLYQVIKGKVSKLIPLAIALGASFHLHFTAIFLPIIVFLSLPLFPTTRKSIKYFLLSSFIFILFLIPNMIYFALNKSIDSNSNFLANNFHGFHLRRVLQLTRDAFIQYDTYLFFDKLNILKLSITPFFFIVYLFKSLKSERIKLCYLIFLWFLIPWLILATFKGEISDYYFIINRFIALLVIVYLLHFIWKIKYIAAKLVLIVGLGIYSIFGISDSISSHGSDGLSARVETVNRAIKEGKKIEFQWGVPEAYIYEYYTTKFKKTEKK